MWTWLEPVLVAVQSGLSIDDISSPGKPGA